MSFAIDAVFMCPLGLATYHSRLGISRAPSVGQVYALPVFGSRTWKTFSIIYFTAVEQLSWMSLSVRLKYPTHDHVSVHEANCS